MVSPSIGSSLHSTNFNISNSAIENQNEQHQTLQPPPPPPPPIPNKQRKSSRSSSSSRQSTCKVVLNGSVQDLETGEVEYFETKILPTPPPSDVKIDKELTKTTKTVYSIEVAPLQSRNDDSSKNRNENLMSSDAVSPTNHLQKFPKIQTADSLEIESHVSSSTQKTLSSWRDRVPWLSKSHNETNSSSRIPSQDASDKRITLYYPPSVALNGRDVLEYNNMDDSSQKQESFYFGGQMDTDSVVVKNIPTYPETPQHISPPRVGSIKKASSFQRVASWIRRTASSSSQTSKSRKSFDADSLADFKETEWTPQDSSYGAAIPLGGWIPKPIRRMIERTLLLVGTVCLVYLIVTTSIKVTDERRKNHNATKNYFYSDGSETTDQVSGCLYLDDDKYVVQGDDCTGTSKYTDADDYFDYNYTDDYSTR